jgi:hypothetical protein
MLGMVEIEIISSLFLPVGRQGGWGQSPAPCEALLLSGPVLSNGVYPVRKHQLLIPACRQAGRAGSKPCPF